MNFLQSVANYYVTHKTESDWNDICFVFTSHRAGVIFRRALQKLLGNRVIFGLRIKTINEFISDKSNLVIADNLTLTFELYKVYHDEVFCDIDAELFDKNRILAFDYFYSWSSMFLGDFDDVDKYMVDARQVFSNTHQYAEAGDDYSHLSQTQRDTILRFWNDAVFKDNFEKSGEQYKERFVEIYKRMFSLYTKFRERLRNRGLAYQGMSIRDVAEKYHAHIQDAEECRYAFIGFNALTKAEKVIFECLRDNHQADFFWDYIKDDKKNDKYQTEHGPWRFISHFATTTFPAPKDYRVPKSEFVDKQIQITEFAYQQGQTSRLNEMLLKSQNILSDEDNEQQMAIILTDENMLVSVLSSIPQGVKYNVTMGYPLKCSTAFSLLNLIANLHRSANEFSNNHTFYYKPFMAILQHPIISSLVDTTEIIDNIISHSYIRVNLENLNITDELLSQIFRNIDNENLIEYIKNIFDTIYQRFDDYDIDDVTRECVYAIRKVICRFGDIILSADNIVTDNSLWFSMLLQLAETQTVDFIGEPVKGLQIMGILESRSLDFNRLVLLDMNEGIFPKTSVSQSLIPYNLRYSYGLPTYEFQDSIFAYYFFRLINRAQCVDLMYVTPSDGRQGMSRFLLQIKYYNNVIPRVAVHVMPQKKGDIKPQITKTPKIMQLLVDEYCKKNYLSPSAFTNYIKCPLYFMYNNILKIGREDDDVIENFDDRCLGTLFHDVMENLYKNNMKNGDVFTNGLKERLKNDKKQIKQLILQGFAKILNRDKITLEEIEGQNVIIYNVVYKMIQKMLDSEPENFVFLAAEEKIAGDDVACNLSSGLKVRLGGIIDRLDKVGNNIRVIDYKTGSTQKADKFYKKNEYHLENILDPLYYKENKAYIQVLIYCYMLRKRASNAIKTDMNPIIIWLKSILKNEKESTIQDISYQEIESDFEKYFYQKLEEIFNPNIPFACTNKKSCEKCMFECLCKKQIVENA